jgi:hypothetical protein
MLVLVLFSSIDCESLAVELGIKYSRIKVPLLPIVNLDILDHHFVVLSKDDSFKVVLDFVPDDRSFTFEGLASSLALILGFSKPGKIRCTYLRRGLIADEVSKIISRICIGWDININIYNHNCQHFCDFIEKEFEAEDTSTNSFHSA